MLIAIIINTEDSFAASYFVEKWYFFQDSLMNRKLKQHSFVILIIL